MKVIQKNLKTNVSHLVLEIKNIEVGVRIPYDVFIKKDENYLIVIEAGTLITDKVYTLLKSQSALYISKESQNKKKLSCQNLEDYIRFNKDSDEKILHLLYEVNAELYTKFLDDEFNQFKLSCLENIVNSIVNLFENNKNFLKDTIHSFSNEYKLDIHSLHVAIYAVHLGLFLKLNKTELRELGMAGLLLDVGIKRINDEVLLKSNPLDREELASIHKHPSYSVEIVKHNHIHNPYILDAIAHHHERYDGSGYPNNLYGHQINTHASILGICDVFDALTNNRPYRKKLSYFEALKFMLKDPSMENKFNREYLSVFLKSLV